MDDIPKNDDLTALKDGVKEFKFFVALTILHEVRCIDKKRAIIARMKSSDAKTDYAHQPLVFARCGRSRAAQ